MFLKVISFLLCFCLLFEQIGFAEVVELNVSNYLRAITAVLHHHSFRPPHLRCISYNPLTNDFDFSLDQGERNVVPSGELKKLTQALMRYFFVGISLPNSAFWVNLSPDGAERILDGEVAKTDIGKIFIESDLQLKKDVSRLSSPETPEGKEYWQRIEKRSQELFGSTSMPQAAVARPWIVPDEIIISETEDEAYIHKATLKVLLEQDHLKDSNEKTTGDVRLDALNEYSAGITRELIIPAITRKVNTAKEYAALRQAYYSLILAQWFKQRFYGRGGLYAWRIDKKMLDGLTSQESWSKEEYYRQYKRSFEQGEYRVNATEYNALGRSIKTYMSGGENFSLCVPQLPQPLLPGKQQRFSLSDGGVLHVIGGKRQQRTEEKSDFLLKGNFKQGEVQIKEQDANLSLAAASPISSAMEQAKSTGVSLKRFLPSFKKVAVFLMTAAFVLVPGLSWAHQFVSRGMSLWGMPGVWKFSNPSENTLWGIARDVLKANGISIPTSSQIAGLVKEIYQGNPSITNPDLIYPGQEILIPKQYVTPEAIAQLTGQMPHTLPQQITGSDGITSLPQGAQDALQGPLPSDLTSAGHQYGWTDTIFSYFTSENLLIGFGIMSAFVVGYMLYRWWKNRSAGQQEVEESLNGTSKTNDLLEANGAMEKPIITGNDPWYRASKENRFDEEIIKKMLFQCRQPLLKQQALSMQERNTLLMTLHHIMRGMPFTPEVVGQNVHEAIKVSQEMVKISLEAARQLLRNLEENQATMSALEKRSLSADIYELIKISDYFTEFENNANNVHKFKMTATYKFRLKEWGKTGKLLSKLTGERITVVIEKMITSIIRFFYGMRTKRGEFSEKLIKIFDKSLLLEPLLYKERLDVIQGQWDNWINDLSKDPSVLLYSDIDWKNRGMIGRLGGILGMGLGSYSLLSYFVTGCLPSTFLQVAGLVAFFLGACSFMLSWYILKVKKNPFYGAYKQKTVQLCQALKSQNPGFRPINDLSKERLNISYQETIAVLDTKPDTDLLVVVVDKDTPQQTLDSLKEKINHLLRDKVAVYYLESPMNGSGVKLCDVYDTLYFSEKFRSWKAGQPRLKNIDIGAMKKLVFFAYTADKRFVQTLEPLTTAPVARLGRPLSIFEWNVLEGIKNMQGKPVNGKTDELMVIFGNALAVGNFQPAADLTMWGMELPIEQVIKQRLGILVPHLNNGSLNTLADIFEKTDIVDQKQLSVVRKKLNREPYYHLTDWQHLEEKDIYGRKVMALGGGVRLRLTPRQAEDLAFFMKGLKETMLTHSRDEYDYKIIPHIMLFLLRITQGMNVYSYVSAAAGGEENFLEVENRERYLPIADYFVKNKNLIKNCISSVGFSPSLSLGSLFAKIDGSSFQNEALRKFTKHLDEDAGHKKKPAPMNPSPGERAAFSSAKKRLLPQLAAGHSGNAVDALVDDATIELKEGFKMRELGISTDTDHFKYSSAQMKKAIVLLKETDMEELDVSGFPVADMINHPQAALAVCDQLKSVDHSDADIESLARLLKSGLNGEDLKKGLGYTEHASSPFLAQAQGQAVAAKQLGGVDLRVMDAQVRKQGTAFLGYQQGALKQADPQWEEFRQMIEDKVVVPAETIKEYLKQKCNNNNFQDELKEAYLCINAIFRLEEELAVSTESSLRDLFCLLDSDKSVNELRLELEKIVLVSEKIINR